MTQRDEFAAERREKIIEALSWWEDEDGRWGDERAADVLAAHEAEWMGHARAHPAPSAVSGASLTDEEREALRLTDDERESANEAMQEGEWQWFGWLYAQKVERIVAARVTEVERELCAENDVLLNAALAQVAKAEERADRAEAELNNVQHDYDSRGERLWRLAATAGHEPNPADNDASAELTIAATLAEGADLRERLARVEQVAEDHAGTIAGEDLRAALASTPKTHWTDTAHTHAGTDCGGGTDCPARPDREALPSNDLPPGTCHVLCDRPVGAHDRRCNTDREAPAEGGEQA